MKLMLSASLIFVVVLGLPQLSCHASEIHVATNGNDGNQGTRARPLRTIQRAAVIARPGDVITVHRGVYRERVDPPRGGTSDRQRIVYRAAPGEKVEIKGSEIIRNWVRVRNDVWNVSLPNDFFHGFNPYSDLIHGDWFDGRGRDHHTGAVYLDGSWLIEAAKLEDLFMPTGSTPAWMDEAGEQYLVNVEWLRPGTGSENHVPATAFTAKHGTQNAACSEGGECVGWIGHGDWLRYDRIDFGTRAVELEIRAASDSEGGVIEVRDGAPDGDLLGSCSVPNTGGWQAWSSFKPRIKPVGGVHTVCLVFRRTPSPALKAGLWFASVDAARTTIWAQFPGVNPNGRTVEVNVRRTVFYPDKPNCDYITVRGFIMRHAATPWAPPTAEQIGLIGTHWSKGWVIEDNTVSHSTCSGIALGKYGDEWDNRSANSAEGYVETIRRALGRGWSREKIGHHVVRRNHISHCEQAGVVGSLGAAFSEVSDNTIHDIHVRRLFSGAEMAGIKFHGAIDTTIRNNHIYRTCLGLWLDWMAQGTRVSGNLFHDNGMDLFTEVDHGPFVVDNNLFLSRGSFQSCSRGGAFAHNLFGGAITVFPYDSRQTPYHKAHSTEVAGYHDNPRGDDRYYNNIFVGTGDLSQYDDAKLPVWMDGNVFLNGARPSRHEKDPLVLPDFDPQIKLAAGPGGLTLHARGGRHTERKRMLVISALLGTAAIPGLPYEQPDGAPVRIDKDILGKRRNASNPTVGPLEAWGNETVEIKLPWRIVSD